MSKTNVHLYRSVRIEQFPSGTIMESQPAPEILYPDFEERLLPSGKVRKADIDTFADANGQQWVKAGKGTSLFDRANVFKAKGWLSFEIPQGTVIPDSLLVRLTDHNDRYNANHFQIESLAKTMRLDAFKGALDNLARNAIARSIEVAKLETSKS